MAGSALRAGPNRPQWANADAPSVCFTEKDCRALGWIGWPLVREAVARLPATCPPLGRFRAWVYARDDGAMGLQVWFQPGATA